MADTTLEETKKDIEKMRFLDVFEEDKNETLTLKINLRVNGEDFTKDQSFRKDEKIAGINFHLLRYLDLGVEMVDKDIFNVTGFFGQK